MQIDLPSNEGAAEAIDLLTPIQKKYAEKISWADLIVYAGGVAVEESGGPKIPFCPGRVDAEEGSRETTADLSPRTYYRDPLVAARDNIKVHLHPLSARSLPLKRHLCSVVLRVVKQNEKHTSKLEHQSAPIHYDKTKLFSTLNSLNLLVCCGACSRIDVKPLHGCRVPAAHQQPS